MGPYIVFLGWLIFATLSLIFWSPSGNLKGFDRVHLKAVAIFFWPMVMDAYINKNSDVDINYQVLTCILGSGITEAVYGRRF